MKIREKIQKAIQNRDVDELTRLIHLHHEILFAGALNKKGIDSMTFSYYASDFGQCIHIVWAKEKIDWWVAPCSQTQMGVEYITKIQCPGIANLDSSWWTEGLSENDGEYWDGDERVGAIEDVIFRVISEYWTEQDRFEFCQMLAEKIIY